IRTSRLPKCSMMYPGEEEWLNDAVRFVEEEFGTLPETTDDPGARTKSAVAPRKGVSFWRSLPRPPEGSPATERHLKEPVQTQENKEEDTTPSRCFRVSLEKSVTIPPWSGKQVRVV